MNEQWSVAERAWLVFTCGVGLAVGAALIIFCGW